MHHHERSNTISSYHGHESGVYPPVPPEDEEVNTPQSQPITRNNSETHPVLNGKTFARATSMSPAVSTNFDPEIVPPPILSNDKHGLHLEMNHPIKPHPASAQKRPGMTKRKKLKKPSKKRIKHTQKSISHHTTTTQPIPSPSQGLTTTAAVPPRRTFPIFDSLSTPPSHSNINHHTNPPTNLSQSRSAPPHPHPAPHHRAHLGHHRDHHSDPPNARDLDPLLNRRDHQNTSSQNQARSPRSIRDAHRSTHQVPARSPPLRTIPSASILDSAPLNINPLPPANHSNHRLRGHAPNNITASNNPSHHSPLHPVDRELSLSHSRSLSYSNRETSPIPPPMSSCSPNPNSSSFIGNPSPFAITPSTPPHPDYHDPAQHPHRFPTTTSNRTNNKSTPTPPSTLPAHQQTLPQHQQQHSDSVSMPSPQIQPPRPKNPAPRPQTETVTSTRNGQTLTVTKRSSMNSLPQSIIIIHKKNKKRRSPSPHSRSRSRSRSHSKSKSPSPSGRSIVKPQTAEKALAAATSPMASNGQMVSAYNSSDDGVDSSGGSTPILSDGDTSSIEVVVEPIQPKHGVIFEDEQNQEAITKRDTPLPTSPLAKKSKYDDNLDFAANQKAPFSMSQVSESEDAEAAEFDPLD